MLVYHPALDAHHCMLRVLRLLHKAPGKKLQIDQLRILDFYLLFPHLLTDVSVLRGQVAKKNKFAKRASKYNRVPSPRMLMLRLREVQTAAVHTLASKGMLNEGGLRDGEVALADLVIGPELQALIDDQTPEDKEVVDYLSTQITRIPVAGSDGLKSRTGLLEHRYDPA